MNKLVYSLFFAIIIMMASCNRNDENIEYVPFQSDEDGKYGLISPDGKVLVDEEFKHIPTMASCGRYWAMNKEGYYELYKTDKSATKLDGEYRYVSMFYNGRAIVAERDKKMSIIDTNGEKVASLGEIDKYEPDYIINMAEGHAVFAVDTLQGVINYKGEMIAKPNYYAIAPMHDGMMVAVDKNYAVAETYFPDPKAKKQQQPPKGYVTVLNKWGEKVMKISSHKYFNVSDKVYGEYLPVAVRKDSIAAWGIINLKGEEIVKPSDSYSIITGMQGDNFIYVDKEGKFGVKDINGNSIVKCDYDYIEFVGNNLVAAGQAPEGDGGWGGPCVANAKLISLDGKEVSNKKYDLIQGMLPSAYKYTFALTSSGKWKIIDNKGQEVEAGAKLASVSLFPGDLTIQSDFIDIEIFLDNIGISAGGVDSLSFQSNVQTVLKRQARYFSTTNTPKASDLTNISDVTIYRTVNGQSVTERVVFPTTLGHRTFRTETVYDYDYYYNSWGNYWDTYWYSYDRQVPAGFAYTTDTPSKFEVTFDNYGVFRGKLKQLYKRLSTQFKQMGRVVDENKGGVVIELDNGKSAVIYLDGHNVVARWGNLNDKDKNISGYYAAKESITLE